MQSGFELTLVKIGANFLIKKYAATFDTYMPFLSSREVARYSDTAKQKQITPASGESKEALWKR